MYHRQSDRVLKFVLSACALISGGLVLLIFSFLLMQSLPAITSIGIGRLLSDTSWHPTATDPKFGVWPMVVGSCLVTLGAIGWALPAGLATALAIEFYSVRYVGSTLTRAVELIGGVPSVVFGFWGLVSLVPLISYFHPPGQSLIAGILILGLMVAPTVVLTSLTALRSVPGEYRRGAVALGLGRARYICSVAIPTAARGILGGALLAAARAIGETMAVLMVCGNIPQIPSSLFEPVRTVTANIALEMGDDTAFHRSVLFLTGLLLMVVILFALGAAEPFRKRAAHG